jgi:hypothetical protein
MTSHARISERPLCPLHDHDHDHDHHGQSRLQHLGFDATLHVSFIHSFRSSTVRYLQYSMYPETHRREPSKAASNTSSAASTMASLSASPSPPPLIALPNFNQTNIHRSSPPLYSPDQVKKIYLRPARSSLHISNTHSSPPHHPPYDDFVDFFAVPMCVLCTFVANFKLVTVSCR